MTFPVLPGEGPMTDETLAAMARRIDAHEGPDHYQYSVEGIGYDAHWKHDTRRLLGEIQRLRAELATFDFPDWVSIATQQAEINRLTAEFADFREMAVSNSKAANEAVDRARSECAALTAKAEAAAAVGERVEGALAHIRECLHIGLQDAKLYDEAGTKRIDEWADFIDKQIRAALAGSGRGTGGREPHARPQGGSDA